MKQPLLSIATLAGAVLVSGCVAYPAGGYRDGAYRGSYYGDRHDRDYRGVRDCRDDRDCERRDGRHDRVGEHRDDHGPRYRD